MQQIQRLKQWIFTHSTFLIEVGTLSTGVLIAQIIFLSATPVISRLYTPEAFGYFGVVINVMSILALFATFRAEVLIPIVKRKRDAQSILFLIVTWSAIFSGTGLILLVLFGDLIGNRFDIFRQYEHVALYIPVLAFLLAAYSALRYYRIRNEHYTSVAFGQILRSIFNVFATIGYALIPVFPPGAQGLVIGQTTGDAVFSLSMLKIGKREAAQILNTSRSMIWRMFARNGKLLKTMFFTQCLATTYQRIPILIIAITFGPVQAGFFALAEKVIAGPTALVSTPIGDVYRQKAVAAFRRSGRFHDELKRTIKLAVGLATLPFLAAILLTPYLIGPVFGDKWVGASDVFVVLLIGSYVSFVVQPLDKGGWIVGATGYIITYHTFRFVFELAVGLAAIYGQLSFIEFLVGLTVVRTFALTYMLAKEWRFSLGKI